MLATGEVPPLPDGEDPHRPVPYPWEATEVQAGQRRSIWLASIEDYRTGEGLTAHFVVSFAHDEDEFRRRVSLELGRELAHLADVRKGISEHPLEAFFLSQRASNSRSVRPR